MSLEVGIEKSYLATQLIKQLRRNLRKNLSKERKNPNTFIFDLKDIKDKGRFQSLLQNLQQREMLTYRKSLLSFIVQLSSKGVKRVLEYESW